MCVVHLALEIVGLAIVTVVVAGLCRRFDLPAPLFLIAAGVAVSFIPGTPEFDLDPNVVLVGLLPPLLYAAAIRTSLVDFKANAVPIALLSVGLVAFSTVAIGFVTWAAAPGITLAAGLALGAVVAPPDAVAAAAVARRVHMPRSIVTLLEDESLVNDAAALVALNVTVASITGSVGAPEIVGRFALAVAGGIVIGAVVAMVLSKIRSHINDPVLDTALSFTAPYLAFLPAEAIHSSGVLAVVVTGLLLGHRAPVVQNASSRISENINWRTVQFLLENVVFVLIGLQLRVLLRSVQNSGVAAGTIVWICLAVFVVTVAARAVWVMVAVMIFRTVPALRERAWSWQAATVVSWAGMRGVVTLAAAYLLPDETPHRDVLRLVAFVVVAGTLVVQGLTLPTLVRRLNLIGPDAAEDALRAAAVVHEATQAGLRRLDEVTSPNDPPEVLEQLHRRAAVRSNAAWERLGRSQDELEPPSAVYRRLRLAMLDAERTNILVTRDAGQTDNEVLHSALRAIDLEESLLDRADDAESRFEDDLRAPRRGPAGCEHLAQAPSVTKPDTPGACGDCLREGTTWVHLRMCLSCGHVGCCDSSVGKHADRHFHESAHPVMRSIEPREAWRWCYIDELVG
jgi:CPA1 family monovalent cation:H+ antiporter